ncbi:MAG: ATP phosphoribosyltransferase regulatory subunit, partial [Thermoleophilia bacterium]|nr:ATP phosphoribosyltransferase regulatory subunit [Thermoleophilia bacterium]
VGVEGVRVAVGDVSLLGEVIAGCGVPPDAAGRLRTALGARSLVAWRRATGALGVPGPAGELLAALPGLRGGPEVLERVAAAVPGAAPACARLERTLALVAAHGAGDAVMLDLGVLRDWPYYSGIVLEAYAPGVGAPVAVGGRYDGLGARFGRPRPAVGVAVMLDLLHRALAGEAGAAPPLRDGLVLAGGSDDEVAVAVALRAAGLTVVAVPAAGADPGALAAADGWRWVARREGDGWRVTDRAAGTEAAVGRIEEALRSAP